ncbi:MAG: SDR family oxidoreductase [Actinomycetota bacterium]
MTRTALVTGATGYIGGRLVPELLAAGFAVRALVRTPSKLRDRPWAQDVEIVRGDLAVAADVTAAARGSDVAYYLAHSLGTGPRFERRDRDLARTFARAARTENVSRIIYLGGLYPDVEDLSAHLDSRKEVGEILLDSGVPTAVLRAAVIIGSGSASFEMLRHLTDRLPMMITPRWVQNRIQPIAVRDVLRYLVSAADLPRTVSRGFDIGGSDVLTYRDMMHRYATIAGLTPRRIFPVNVLTPQLSSHWVGIVTPVPGSIARPLVESLVHEVVCKEHDIARHIPDPPQGLIGFNQAVELALAKVRSYDVATNWASASIENTPSDPLPSDPDWSGGTLYVDERTAPVHASRTALWSVIEGIGGQNGWYSWPLAWWTRGLLDRLSGGPGLRRGRRDPYDLVVGDALDWWRVEEIQDLTVLRLRAEMRLPGLAWLELIIDAPPTKTSTGVQDSAGRSDQAPDGPLTFRQRALFAPHGLAGRLYWLAIRPFHGIVFGGMRRNIAIAAERAGQLNQPQWHRSKSSSPQITQ